MIYCILCGGIYTKFDTPRPLLRVDGERLLNRTIKLLTVNDVSANDIWITYTDNRVAEYVHQQFYNIKTIYAYWNNFVCYDYNKGEGMWVDAFPPKMSNMHFPKKITFLFGDVFYSPEAINTIINEKRYDYIDFFASSPPFNKNLYFKEYAEPFAFKVYDTTIFYNTIGATRLLYKEGMFNRHPIAWELWQVIRGSDFNTIDYTDYIPINDYTTDIDEPEDIKKLEQVLNKRFI